MDNLNSAIRRARLEYEIVCKKIHRRKPDRLIVLVLPSPHPLGTLLFFNDGVMIEASGQVAQWILDGIRQ